MSDKYDLESENVQPVNKYKLTAWWRYSHIERSWVILRAYKEGVLKKEEVEELLRRDTYDNWMNVIAPTTLFAGGYYGLKAFYPDFFRITLPRQRFAVAATSFVLWQLFWKEFSPSRANLWKEKENLLQLITQRIGNSFVLSANEFLPRYMTEYEVHRKLRVLHNRRGSMLSGVLWSSNEFAQPDLNPFTFKQKSYSEGPHLE